MIPALIIALFAIGVILIIVELFVTPGFVVGLLGLGFMAAGIYSIYDNYGIAAGNTALIVVSVALLIFIVLGLRSGFWSRIASKEMITGKANTLDKLDLKPGQSGKAISALRPTGSAIIDGKRYEVLSEGEFIDSSELIEVTKVVENKIYVKLKI